jgi:hypothetical protein
MRIKCANFIIYSLVAILLGCGKPGAQREVSNVNSVDIAFFEKSITDLRSLMDEAMQLKSKAEGGDALAANRWRAVTNNSSQAIRFLNNYEESAKVDGIRSQLKIIRKEMRKLGWFSLRPAWLSAKLGDADAQNEIHDFFINAQEGLVVLREVGGGGRPGLRKPNPWTWGEDAPAELPQIEVLADSCRQISYSYLVDSFWTPPAGKWDPLYVEGCYRYDGIEFTPRDWLLKAAATDSKFKAKLAAMDFVSAKSDAERIVAAKVLLSFPDNRSGLEGKSLVESCLAAIYYRGIAVQADFSKAAEIMLSSADNALKARGVKLVCEKNLPVKQVGDQVLHESEGLLYAIYSKYGYGLWKRDFERAYFEYWLFLWRVNGSPGGDANFARMELAELEKQLSAEEIISLHKRCMTWFKKFDGKSPYIDDWISR